MFFLIGVLAFAQAPEKFTYQSIIKNSSGYLLKNQEIGLRISILFNSSSGISVYSEEHSAESNSNGLVTLIIGEGVSSDVFSDIDWGNGEYYLKVEVDPEGGINYTMNQTSQLLSVPYALYAGNSNTNINLFGQDYITLNNQTLTINKIDLSDDVDGILSINNGGIGTNSAPMIGVITSADPAAARIALGLDTAATTATSDYATAAQGALADTALQSSNNLGDLDNLTTALTNLGLGNTDNVTFGSFTGNIKTTAADGTVSTVLNSNVGSDDAAIFTGNVTGDVTGNLTGNVTGDVTGGVTGDVTGNHTGNVTGDVTGNLTGNVTGDVTGGVTGDVTGNLTGNVTGDVTVGSGKTLDISSGTLTVADNQISGDKVEGGTIAATTITSLTSSNISIASKTITPIGTTGDRTINAIAGSVNFGSSDTSVRVTNSFVDENSVILLTKGSQGTSGGTQERKLWVVPNSSGYFDINVDFSYGNETKMFFLVIN